MTTYYVLCQFKKSVVFRGIIIAENATDALQKFIDARKDDVNDPELKAMYCAECEQDRIYEIA